MKNAVLLIIAVLTLVSSLAFATPSKLTRCDRQDFKYLMGDIMEVAGEGYSIKYMKNESGQLVGFFGYGKGDQDARASVCGFKIANDETVASSWYYWDREQGLPNPAQWSKDKKLSIYQDEGFLNMTVVKASKTGDVTLALSIEGTDEGAAPAVRDTVVLSDE
jgi:hypothetical protein